MTEGRPVGARAVRAAAPGLLLAAIVLLPFVQSAYTVDDPLFLLQARHILVDPLHPSAFEGTFATAHERMSHASASGPGMPYLLVPCVAFGGAEWIAHLTQLVILMTGLIATASLALRLGAGEASARASAILLAATPALAGMAGTAMPDVPAMAFGVVGVERAVAFRHEGGWWRGVAGCTFLSLAVLSRSHLIALIAIAALACAGDFLALLSWSRVPRSVWLTLLACPVAVAAALAVTRDPYAGAAAAITTASRFVHVETIPRNTIAYLVHWAVALPLALPWCAIRPREIVRQPALYAGAWAAGLFLYFVPTPGAVFVALAAGLSAGAIADLIADAVKRADRTQLLLGLWVLAPLVVVPYLHLPSKYVLAAAPGAAIAVARGLETIPRTRARAILATTVACGALLGVLILRADARFAGLGRRAAQELIPPAGAAAATTWFDGHWGFQWYAENAGARPMSTEPPYPAAGDSIVSSAMTGLGFVDALPSRRLLRTITDETAGGRVMSRRLGAGFFTNDFGYWPWAWGRDPVDRYDLWSIGPGD